MPISDFPSVFWRRQGGKNGANLWLIVCSNHMHVGIEGMFVLGRGHLLTFQLQQKQLAELGMHKGNI